MNSIRWDDLVFANRNQMYGAYPLRKAYSRRLTLSFGMALTVMIMLLAYPSISRMFESEVAPTTTIPDGHGPITLEPPPPIRPDFVPPPRITVPDQIRFVPPRVTEQEVEDVPPTIDDLQNVQISDLTIEGDQVFIDDPVVEVIAPEVTEEPIYVWVEQAPEFPGGVQEMMRFIAKNVKYPAIARRQNIEGSVYISFVVNTDGSIVDIKTERGVFTDLDNEAIRVIGKMPAWKPGKQNGKSVRVKFMLPIKFALEKS